MSHTTGGFDRAGARSKTPQAGRPSGSGDGTAQVAKDQAAGVGQEAKASGQHVADVAKDQAASVVGETGRQAKDLLGQGRDQLREQAANGQQRAASGLTALADELRDLAEGKGGSGMATDLARQASQRVSTIATWVSDREPADLLSEVQSFARRRPGAFLALAAGVGVVAGRLTRGLGAAAHEASVESAAQGQRASAPTGPTGPTGPVGQNPGLRTVPTDDLTGVASSADVLGQPNRQGQRSQQGRTGQWVAR